MNTKEPINLKTSILFDSVSGVLGKPFFRSKNCLIYNLDCLEAMKKMPSNCINLAVTSPPYNIGKEYENTLPLDDYLAWCKQWIDQVYRLITPNGAFWLNLGYLSIPQRAKAIPIPYLLWDKVPFYLIQEIVWNYGAGVAGSKFFSPRNEKFLWYVKNKENYVFNLDDVRDPNIKYPNQKKNGKIKVNPIGKNPTDVWQFPKVTSGKNRSSKERTPHPAQFPIAVIERIVKSSSNENDIILDPFMGSGTTAAAALTLGRSVIGFETNLNYCAITAERVENVFKKNEEYSIQMSIF